VTGVWEKAPGSGVWWVRYRVDGKLRREKVGRKGDAIDLYHTRKAGIRAGVKLPDNLRSTGVKFKALADAILSYSDAHHKDRRNIISRLRKIQGDFDDRMAEEIKPQDIDAWLTANTKTPATSNRYRALFSLIYREALRNGKVTSNPARLVRQRH
jgi:integrase